MKIIFICSGNTFRSFTGEIIARKYVKDHNIEKFEVSSAGTKANLSLKPYPKTIERLKEKGIDDLNYNHEQVTKEILEDKDVIICFSKRHQNYVKELGFDSVLFNELAYNKKEDLMDDGEYEEIHGKDYDLNEYIDMIVDYIDDAMPIIFKNLLNKN